MNEFARAKVKRENFVSHNDKAIKLVEDLVESKDTKDKTRASLDRITAALGKEATEKKDGLLNSLVLQLAHSRDNNLIEQFLGHIGSEYRAKAFHAFVLKLTCNDDWNTLDTVLHYGRTMELKPEIPGGNPIAIASEQVSHLSVKQYFNDKLC